jgi:hypothetical protein
MNPLANGVNEIVYLIVRCFSEQPVMFTLLTVCLVFGPSIQRAGARRAKEREAKRNAEQLQPVPPGGDWRVAEYESQAKGAQPPSPPPPDEDEDPTGAAPWPFFPYPR